MALFILFLRYWWGEEWYFWHFSHNHLNDYCHSLLFYLYGIHSLILPLFLLQFFWLCTIFILTSSICFPLVPTLPFHAFHYIPFLVCKLKVFLFPVYTSWDLSWFDYNFCSNEGYQADHHMTPMLYKFSCKWPLMLNYCDISSSLLNWYWCKT